MKKLLVLLFVSFLCLNAFAVKVKVLESNPFPAKAGEFADVFISIENNSRSNSGNVLLEFIPKDSIRLAFGQEAVKDVGIIPGNKAITVKYRVEITADAVDGENVFELNVFEGLEVPANFDLSIEVENDLPNIELGDFDSEPRKILPDTDDVKISVTLLNTGEASAESVKATLKIPGQLEFSESFSDVSLLGNLEPNASGKADFFINVPEEALSGKYAVELLVEYSLSNSKAKGVLSKTLLFEIPVKPVPRFEITQVETIPKEVVAGERNLKLRIEIKNVGEEEAESVRFKVFQKSEQPFEFDKAFDFLAPKLKPGETAQTTLELKVDEKANPQKYLLEAEVKSFAGDSIIIENETIELNVSKAREEFPNIVFLLLGALVVLGIVLIVFRRRLSKASEKKKSSAAK